MNRKEALKKGKVIADRWWYDNKSTGNQQTKEMAEDQMKLRQKIKEYLFYRHVFYCLDCRYTLRLSNKLLQQCHPWDGPYCPKCGEKIQKSDSACKHRVTKENASKEMLTHGKRTFHSRSIFD